MWVGVLSVLSLPKAKDPESGGSLELPGGKSEAEAGPLALIPSWDSERRPPVLVPPPPGPG